MVWTLRRGGAGFPAALEDLGDDCPAVLYGCGEAGLVGALVTSESVAIVGGRRATPYALDAARALAAELAEAGMTVVSGMAFGVDGAAHRGALDVRSPTVAVLAGGPERASPRGQGAIYKQILAGAGAVISENPPGTSPYAAFFPRRNRIMAALAGMTVVIEAAERSGSLITARQAAMLGREVGAVPGQIGIARSVGSNALLADGACLVRDAADVFDALLGPGAVPRRAVASAWPVDPELQPLLEALEDGIGDIDALAIATGAGAQDLARRLARLELEGRVVISPAGRYELSRCAAGVAGRSRRP